MKGRITGQYHRLPEPVILCWGHKSSQFHHQSSVGQTWQLTVAMKQKYSPKATSTLVPCSCYYWGQSLSITSCWNQSTSHLTEQPVHLIQVPSVVLLGGRASITGPYQFDQVTVESQVDWDVTSCHCSA